MSDTIRQDAPLSLAWPLAIAHLTDSPALGPAEALAKAVAELHQLSKGFVREVSVVAVEGTFTSRLEGVTGTYRVTRHRVWTDVNWARVQEETTEETGRPGRVVDPTWRLSK
jgi:hypothetical protein